MAADVSTSSSWKLESSHTTDSPDERFPSSPQSGRPTLPQTATGRPAAEDGPEQLGRRRLAVRPRDGHGRLCDQTRAELDLAPHGHAELARARDERRLARYPGAPDQHLHAFHQRDVRIRAEDNFDAGLAKPAHVCIQPAVDPEHADTPARQRERAASPERASPSTSAVSGTSTRAGQIRPYGMVGSLRKVREVAVVENERTRRGSAQRSRSAP